MIEVVYKWELITDENAGNDDDHHEVISPPANEVLIEYLPAHYPFYLSGTIIEMVKYWFLILQCSDDLWQW